MAMEDESILINKILYKGRKVGRVINIPSERLSLHGLRGCNEGILSNTPHDAFPDWQAESSVDIKINTSQSDFCKL